MATKINEVVDHKQNDLELLRSGNFSDAVVVCNDRSWKCHQAILVPRSVWFRKALTGPFKEAATGRVSLEEHNPVCVDLALKYIYGGGLNVMASVSKQHFVEHCVSLWHTADFLMLKDLKSTVEKAVFSYCDTRMKELCTTPYRSTWRHPMYPNVLSPWALDLVTGVRDAYKWDIKPLKEVLMEFLWVGRALTLANGIASTLFNHLKDVPSFTDDFLGQYASRQWLRNSVWAPRLVKNHPNREVCLTCAKAISWDDTARTHGQVIDAFRRDGENVYRNGWCRDCSAGDKIPWRT